MRLPDCEVASVFEDMYRRVLRPGFGGEDSVRCALTALVQGQLEPFETLLARFLKHSLSYYGFAGREPKRLYQALILGMLVTTQGTHEVRSNRESGFCRYDVMIFPKQAGQAAVVMELKVLGKRETAEQALASALEQIRTRDYAAEARTRGAGIVYAVAVVFEGKEVWVRPAE